MRYVNFTEITLANGSKFFYSKTKGTIFYWALDDQTGFGGDTVRIGLESGEIREVKGPWMSNAFALYRATGVDMRPE